MIISGKIISTLAFLGAKAVPEALEAVRQAYASHPGAAADITRTIQQNHLQDAAKAMENLAPRCASNVSSALRTAARHLRS